MARKNKKTREEFLVSVVDAFRPWFIEISAPPIPKKLRIACGFPRVRGGGGHAIGQAWHVKCSDDKTAEIFVSPAIAEKAKVMEVVLHECVHHAVGIEAGHGKKFREVAVGLGLEGKMTSTVAGRDLRKRLRKLGAKLGRYPHAALIAGDTIKRNKNRHLKVTCVKCDANYRSSFGNFTEHGAPKHCNKLMEISI